MLLRGDNMKWSLLELRRYQEQPLTFQTTLDLKDELKARDKEIIDLAPVEVKGIVSVNPTEYILHYTLSTVMTLPSTRSLEPVALPITFTVDEVFMTPEQFQHKDERMKEEEILLLETQTLDLSESVADNLLLEIPLQVLTEEEKRATTLPKGENWAVLSEEEYLEMKESQAESQVDPRLAKLSSLFENSDEDNR